jgi:hypothetical protein
MSALSYVLSIIQKYQAHDLSSFLSQIIDLKSTLRTWAGNCYLEILDSGSRAKGTAISLASDVDFLISLKSSCNTNNGGLKSIYDSLYTVLANKYSNVRRQNVSVRIELNGLEIDVTPARQLEGYKNYHSLYVSKSDTWKQTNIQKHISDISQSGRQLEIRFLKIWREQYQLDFPSIYLEYLLLSNILLGKSKDINDLAVNCWYVLGELAKDNGNPLFSRIDDPSNTNNVLSDLLTNAEKNKIIAMAKYSRNQSNWENVVY